MQFGLCNAPSIYQRLISGVLQSLIGRICLAYFDHIIVFSKKRANHISDLCSVLDRIRSNSLKLKPSKCSLFSDQVLYLGHLISAAGVSPDPVKLQVLAEWPRLSTVGEMQLFLRFFNFYGDYIADYISFTLALYDFTANRKGDDTIRMFSDNVK